MVRVMIRGRVRVIRGRVRVTVRASYACTPPMCALWAVMSEALGGATCRPPCRVPPYGPS